MMSHFDDKKFDIIDAFNTISRYLDDILSINQIYFDNMVSQIYPFELQLNKANTSDTDASFLDLDLDLSVSNAIVFWLSQDNVDNLSYPLLCDDFEHPKHPIF